MHKTSKTINTKVLLLLSFEVRGETNATKYLIKKCHKENSLLLLFLYILDGPFNITYSELRFCYLFWNLLVLTIKSLISSRSFFLQLHQKIFQYTFVVKIQMTQSQFFSVEYNQLINSSRDPIPRVRSFAVKSFLWRNLFY